MNTRGAGRLALVLATFLCLFTLIEVNRPTLSPHGRLALFALLGLVLCFLGRPLHPRLRNVRWAIWLDRLLAAASVFTCGYVFVQSEEWFRRFWIDGQALGDRAGLETPLDVAVGVLGLVLVLEATRRAIGWALPILATLFLLYAYAGPSLPDFLFPHRGYGVERIVAQTFLHSQGVFGTALDVMFSYVFLFVVFGAVLKQTGATQFIIDLAQRVFGSTPGGPAKVSVLSSGLMGSLSGSAVANTATTGTFTIPMMRSSGFSAHVAGGIEAAASSGGALVPPVMGAGAYMMLEIVQPQVTYLEIIRAALIPAMLYYLSLLLIVHFHSKRAGARVVPPPEGEHAGRPEGFVFVAGFVSLIALLLQGYSVFRSVSVALFVVLVAGALHPRTRTGAAKLRSAVLDSGRDVVPLVAASACVGIVIGVVTLTGVGTKLPSTVLALSQGSLPAALFLIMFSSIVLGMGLPSAVCYLLMATLIGPVLGSLGVVPLAAHMFIFYFGMMSMVTPPVALAAYTAASIAGSDIMPTAMAAFRFALVGFTLPYMFVFHPQLLMLDPTGATAGVGAVAVAVTWAVLGILPLAAGIAGYMIAPLGRWQRGACLLAALLLLFPFKPWVVAGTALPLGELAGTALTAVTALWSRGGAR